jgi:hypothetical protein
MGTLGRASLSFRGFFLLTNDQAARTALSNTLEPGNVRLQLEKHITKVHTGFTSLRTCSAAW